MLNSHSIKRTRWTQGALLFCAWLFAAVAHGQAQAPRDCTSRSCWMAAVDGSFVTALSSDVMNSGGGVGLRLGLQRDLYPALIIPEAVFEHHVLDTNTPDNAALTRVMAGGRLRVLRGIQPGLFVHMGIGRVAGGRSQVTTDLTFDFGATVDVSVFSWFDLGLHAALNRVFGGDAGGLTFASIGLHAALVLEDKL